MLHLKRCMFALCYVCCHWILIQFERVNHEIKEQIRLETEQKDQSESLLLDLSKRKEKIGTHYFGKVMVSIFDEMCDKCTVPWQVATSCTSVLIDQSNC
jgi:hypothetical protein